MLRLQFPVLLELLIPYSPQELYWTSKPQRTVHFVQIPSLKAILSQRMVLAAKPQNQCLRRAWRPRIEELSHARSVETHVQISSVYSSKSVCGTTLM
jgi:hypothetical protein